MIPCLLNDILHLMSSCFRCKWLYLVSIDNSTIDFARLNFDPGNMNKNFVLFTTAKKAS